MRRTIQQDQNNGKALEIRLEQEGQTQFHVILAGVTFHLRSGCASGRCEYGGDEDYMFIDNETYQAHSFPTYTDAKKAYDIFKTRYID